MQLVSGHPRWWYAAGAVALGVVIAVSGLTLWSNTRLPLAERLMEDGRWSEARDALAAYLKLAPRDDRAHLLMARSLISDNSLSVPANVHAALRHLGQIPGQSSLSADARVHEGRLYLLLLLQPGRAERCFLEALQREPHRVDAHSLLWKLYDLTGRWHLTDPHFWEVYERTAASGRSVLLRDWYLSEFSPAAAAADLDRRLGLLGEAEQPSADTERRRLEAFVTAEADWSVGCAALARWHQQHGPRSRVHELLTEAERLESDSPDPFVVATRVAVSIELGEFDGALRAFNRWPPPHEGYEYWKHRALVADEILRDDNQAREAYERALDTPAGQSDWLTRHSLAQCLSRLGEHQLAASARQRSQEIELQMEPKVHGPLRQALRQPNRPQTVRQMVDFYQRLGRSRESDAWRKIATLPSETGQPSSSRFSSSHTPVMLADRDDHCSWPLDIERLILQDLLRRAPRF